MKDTKEKYSIPMSLKMTDGRLDKIPFVYSDGWISNGYFAIKEELVKDCNKYKSFYSGEMPSIKKMVPDFECTGSNCFIKSRNLIERDGVYMRCFIHDELEVYIDERLVKAFKIENLYQQTINNICLSKDSSLILSPMRSRECK